MTNSKQINLLKIVLGIVQLLLIGLFTWAGVMKLLFPGELPWLWAKENPDLVAVTGVVDLVAGLSLLLPLLPRVSSKLTLYAAYGISILMLAAGLFHILRGESDQIGFNLFVLVCALFLALGKRKALHQIKK